MKDDGIQTMVADVLSRSRKWLERGAYEAGRCGFSGERAVGIWIADRCAEATGPIPDPRQRRLVLGGLQAPSPPFAEAVPTRTPWEFLRPDPEPLMAAAEHVAVGTVFGTRPHATAETVAQWASAVRVGLGLAVRLRDLEVLAALIRTSVFLGVAEHGTVVGAATHLAAQQRPDGGFGGLRHEDDGTEPVEVRLPLTLTSVWALAELARPGLTAEAFCLDPSGGIRAAAADPEVSPQRRESR